MTREEAIKRIRQMSLPKETMEILEALAPELRESEDERIRKELIGALMWQRDNLDSKGPHDNNLILPGFTMSVGVILAYLEKQKEQNLIMANSPQLKEQKPKHFDLEAGKWYICHRAFCCRADHLTVKEGERFMCEKDGVVKGFIIKEPEKYFKECSAPAPMEEMEKEQKPVDNTCGTCCDDERFEIIAQAKKDIIEKTNITENELSMELPLLDGILLRVWQVGWLNRKPAEWSEEDEDFINMLILHFNYLIEKGGDSVETYKSYREKLKSLRPSWKPSDEQMEAFKNSVEHVPNAYYDDMWELYEQLKKLM